MTFQIESIEPSDTSADFRAAVRHFRDNGALPNGVTLETLRSLATHARRVRISTATREALGIGAHADALDLVAAVERKLRRPTAAESGVLIIGAVGPNREYASVEEAATAEATRERRRTAAIDRAAVETKLEPAAETKTSPDAKANDPRKWRRAVKGN